MGGGKKAVTNLVHQENPYDDSWIRTDLELGRQQADAHTQQLGDLTAWMNQRQAALRNPLMYGIGGGMQVAQKDFGQYVTDRFNQQEQAFNQRLAQLQANTGANRQSLQAQGEALARQGERDRVAAAYGGLGGPGVTGVQTKKRKNLGTYSGTGGGFNRSGMRIQNLNV